MPDKGGEGVSEAAGGGSAGYCLYVQNGKLVYQYNWLDRERTNLVSKLPVPPGKSTVRSRQTAAEMPVGDRESSRMRTSRPRTVSASLRNRTAVEFSIWHFPGLRPARRWPP